MQAGEIMTRSVVSVAPDDTVRHAATLLISHGISSLPVVDDGRVVGMVSELDAINGRMPHDARSHLWQHDDVEATDPPGRVADIMSLDVVCAEPRSDTADLARMMVSHGVRAVPVVDGGVIVGIVSRRDVLRTLLRSDATIRTEVDTRLAALAGRADPWTLDVHDGVVTVAGEFADEREQSVIRLLASTVPGVVRVHVSPAAVPTGG